MWVVFFLIFLVSPTLLIVGLINPKLVNNKIKKDFSRKQLAGIFSALLIGSFILTAITAPKTPTQTSPVSEQNTNLKEANEGQVSGVNQVSIESQAPSNQPSPSLSSSPSPSPFPSPTPIELGTPILKPSPSPTAQNIQASPTNQPVNSNCEPAYPDVCIPKGSADYDCAGGSGNGPNYIKGPITVLSPDPYDLDRDHDGIGCEN